MTPELWDMHVHLDFMHDPEEIVREAEAQMLNMAGIEKNPETEGSGSV